MNCSSLLLFTKQINVLVKLVCEYHLTMQKFEEKTVSTLAAYTCDCCGRESTISDDYEASEFISLEYVGGYQSIFGDGTHVSIDICQYCLKDKLGTWLKTTSHKGEKNV